MDKAANRLAQLMLVECQYPGDDQSDHGYNIFADVSRDLKNSVPLGWCGLPWVTAKISPHIRESRAVLNSGFHAVDSGFRIPGTLFHIFFSGTWIPGFWIRTALFRIPRPRILDSQAKISRIPESVFPLTWRERYTWGTWIRSHSTLTALAVAVSWVISK